MEKNYMCPKCKGFLNVDKHVIFSVTTQRNQRGIMLLSPELGDYSVVCHPSISAAKGEKIKFFCPICHTRLASKKYTNLAQIHMVDEKGDVYEVMFSEIAGEQCTFQIMQGEFRVFGEHSQLYREFLEVIQQGQAFRNM